MKLYSKILSLALVVLLISTTMMFAGDKNRVGTAAGYELLIPVGARGLAMGGANISNTIGVDALFWNPAGAARAADNFEITFTNYDYFADLSTNYVAATIKSGSLGTFGVSLKSLSFGDIPITTEDSPDGTGASYNPSFITLGLTYSTFLIDRVAVGVTANYISENIMSSRATGFGASVGIQYVGLGVQGLSLGIAIRNIGSGIQFEGSDLYRKVNFADNPDRPQEYMTFKGSSSELPTTFEMGLSYMQKLDDQNSVEVAGNFINNNYYTDEYKLGLEYAYDNMVYARGSYSLSPQADKDAAGANAFIFTYTFGAGVKTNVEGMTLGIDYCYQDMKYFGSNNMFTITVGF